MDLKKFNYCLLFIIITLSPQFRYALAQGGDNSDKNPLLKEVIPPPPNAAALGTYGDIPVSMYTGIPSISIPIHEIKGRSLSVPLSLSYHAGGHKVEQIASRFGLGWSMQGEAVVTRTMKGMPDDFLSVGYLDMPHSNADLLAIPNTYTNAQKRILLEDVSEGRVDLEPDIFHFNIAGVSGKFVINKDDGSCYPYPYQKIDIQYERDATSGEIFRWTIKGANGVTFILGKSTWDNRQAIERTNSQPGGDSPANPGNYAASWYITEMIHPNGDIIHFYYENYTSYYCQKGRETHYSPVCSKDAPIQTSYNTLTTYGVYLKSIVSSKESVEFIPSTSDRLDLPALSGSGINSDRAMEYIHIKDRLGNLDKKFHLEYEYFESPFVDDPECSQDANALNKRLKLKQVTEISGNNLSKPPYTFTYNTNILPYRFSDAQDHWGYYNGEAANTSLIPEMYLGGISLSGAKRHPNVTDMQACILTSIQYPTGGMSIFEFESHDIYSSNFGFEVGGTETYTELDINNIDTSLPDGPSLLGYVGISTFTVNGATVQGEQTGANIQLDRWLQSPAQPCLDNSEEENCYISVSIKKLSDGTYTHYRSALDNTPSNDILFLANGQYELILEVDQIAYNDQTNPDYDHLSGIKVKVSGPSLNVQYNKPIGGLRIKKITHKDDTDPTNDMVMHYEYKSRDDHTQSSGILLSIPKYAYDYIEINYNGYACYYTIRTAQSNQPLGETQGSHVGYRDVQVYYGENRTNGKSTYRYTTSIEHPDGLINGNFPFPPSTSREWKRGLLLEARDYRQDGSLLKEVVNTYELNPQVGHKKQFIGLSTGCSTFDMASDDNFIGPHCEIIEVSDYYVESDWYYLNATTETVFPEGTAESISTTTNYYYDNPNHIQLTRQTVTNSDGVEHSTEYAYPGDFSASPGKPIAELQDRYMHAIPLEVIKKTNGNVVGGTYTKFSLEDTDVVPRTIYQIATAAPIVGYTSTRNFGTDENALPNAAYEARAEFPAYDIYGNLQQQQKTGDLAKTYYVWGYNHSVPVAQIVSTTINLGEIESLQSSIQNLTGDALISALATLRESNNTFVTTYTYNDRLQLATMTDPNGFTVTYEYDGLGRLLQVIDHKGNTVQENEYNYKQGGN